MTTSGLTVPGAVVNDASGGDNVWFFPERATSINSSGARCDHDPNQSTNSQWLKATNFGFSIPANQRIDGLEMTVTGTPSGNNIDLTIDAVELVKAGVIQSDASSLLTSATIWTSLVYTAYTTGSATALPQALTPGDVNDPGFGVAIQMKGVNTHASDWRSVYIDAIQLNLHYSDAGTGANVRGVRKGVQRGIKRGNQ